MQKMSRWPKATGLWHRCASSEGNRFSTIANASVDSADTQASGQLWEEYFADPSQWWDNRIDKRNRKSPDFRHKVSRAALWVEWWSTPSWVKAKLKQVTQDPLQLPVGYQTRGRSESAQACRPFQVRNGKENARPTITRELRQIGQVRDGRTVTGRVNSASEAVSRLKKCVAQGIAVESHRYVEVLQSCFKQGDLGSAKEVHECSRMSGMEKNVYVANNLLRVYIRCGRFQDARQVFDNLEKKSVVSWNSMVGGYAQHGHAAEALELLNQMRQAGVQANEITYLGILQACLSTMALKEVHAHIRRGGFESDVRVGTALLKLYAKSGSIKEAREVFDKLTRRDVMSWAVMIGAYAKNGDFHEARSLFLHMQQEGHIPDAVIYLSLLTQGETAVALEWVKEVHDHALKRGLVSDVRVATALLNMYAKCGSIKDAAEVFDKMSNRNVISWNALIGAYARSGCGVEAYQLYLKMRLEGFVPNAITFTSVLNPACASAGALDWVKDIHRHALEAGVGSDVRVGTALVHMYAKSGSIDDARVLFRRMQERNAITWNVMISGLAEHNLGHEAYELFLQMQQEGLKPDAFTYVSILNPCASDAGLEWVREVHRHAANAELELELRVGNALIHMYAKCGSIDDARLVFDRMMERDVITWNLMLGGLAEHGCGHEALELFRQMSAEEVEPDERSFLAVLVACSHAGLVEEGRCLFLAMTQDHGIKPTIVHYTCMVDLLGRAGYLEEAEHFIQSMPLEPNARTWGALLGACRTHGDVELAEHAARELLKLDPKDASVYVLLSNMYAAAGRWDQVTRVRSLMMDKGIRKEPGVSWIEVDNKIHRFCVRDMSHPEAKEIYAVLKDLTQKLKAQGYIPDTKLVLRNIHEEDKELALCSHSEKLAIAYGLMHTPPGKPIRVRQNLRVCTDCHTATKFISKVTGREIVARDANRFHHFKNGVCSCGDFW
ncbi:hypothetical protein KC19_9G185500 [Ceratodon purpureus]|uniref:DYW domain-containing protein n=1 Tax=Ceratodon purpureus TaxID=3225 RepID=A0A8T0GVA8_CERPU|nr:hypothetical protein KC19_9G185500 [Ceratodon purpureus]